MLYHVEPSSNSYGHKISYTTIYKFEATLAALWVFLIPGADRLLYRMALTPSPFPGWSHRQWGLLYNRLFKKGNLWSASLVTYSTQMPRLHYCALQKVCFTLATVIWGSGLAWYATMRTGVRIPVTVGCCCEHELLAHTSQVGLVVPLQQGSGGGSIK